MGEGDVLVLLGNNESSGGRSVFGFRQVGSAHLSGRHAVVVGGGIVGCTTAMLLRQQGWQVTVVERNIIATRTSGESSWAGAGIVFPLLPWFYQDAVNQLALEGAKLYPTG